MAASWMFWVSAYFLKLWRFSNRVRVLVCAPSNAALDEVAARLMHRMLDKSGNIYSPMDGSIVRVGARRVMHPIVQLISLDSLTTRFSSSSYRSRDWVDILDGASVVCATLSGCGNSIFDELEGMFDVVIIGKLKLRSLFWGYFCFSSWDANLLFSWMCWSREILEHSVGSIYILKIVHRTCLKCPRCIEKVYLLLFFYIWKVNSSSWIFWCAYYEEKIFHRFLFQSCITYWRC